jgi:hypothetical protein
VLTSGAVTVCLFAGGLYLCGVGLRGGGPGGCWGVLGRCFKWQGVEGLYEG